MRRLLLSLALAVSLSPLYASPALARRGHHHHQPKAAPEGAQKAPLCGPEAVATNCEVGTVPTPNTFGFAILNTPGNETTVTGEVALKHAAPHATYFVGIASPQACIMPILIGTLTTNGQGNGTFEINTERTPGSTKFFVALLREVTPAKLETFGTPAVELD